MYIDAYQHRTGINCETTCVRNVLDMFGVEFAEEVLPGQFQAQLVDPRAIGELVAS